MMNLVRSFASASRYRAISLIVNKYSSPTVIQVWLWTAGSPFTLITLHLLFQCLSVQKHCENLFMVRSKTSDLIALKSSTSS